MKAFKKLDKKCQREIREQFPKLFQLLTERQVGDDLYKVATIGPFDRQLSLEESNRLLAGDEKRNPNYYVVSHQLMGKVYVV